MRFSEIINESSSKEILSILNDNIVVYHQTGQETMPIQDLIDALNSELHFHATPDAIADDLEGNKLIDHIDRDQRLIYFVSDKKEQQQGEQDAEQDQAQKNAEHVERMAASAAKSPLRDPLK